MSLTIVVTAKSASANCYCTFASANEYLQRNIHTYSAWSSLASTDSKACLIWATSILDQKMDWNGGKATAAQALRWPRDDVSDADDYAVDSSTIPVFLQEATAEFARWLSVEDRTEESPTKGFSRLEGGGLAAYINARDRPQIIPPVVSNMIIAYGTVGIGSSRVLELR